MRKYILYMVGLVLSVATVGCVKTDDPSANQSGMVTLQLSNGTLTTRAVGTNDDTNNEDLIADAQVFFFDSNADSATVKYSYYTNITDVRETATISIPLSTEQLTSLFPGGNGYVYVIANYGSEITGATTLAALKATAITSTFGTDVDGVQPSFIMDSDLTTVARGTANTISGEVFLTRAAAKVELTVKVTPIEQDGKQWIADTANMRLSFNNGVSNGFIDDGSDEEGAEPANGGTTFDIAGRGFTLVTGAAGSGSFVQSVPFYSYSTKWTTGAENEVYLELAIPWAVKTEGDAEPTYQTFYYQVPVSADALTLVRNAYYKLTLDVGVLGGLTKPVTVVPSYVVIDWGTNDVNVTLSRPKYLVVDENKVDVFNQNTYSIGYQSSDNITVKIVSLTRDDLSGNTAGTTTYHSSTAGVTSVNAGQQDTDNKYKLLKTCSVSVENGQIVFSHDLVNTDENTNNNADGYPTTGDYRNRDDYDFAPYYITLLVEMQVDNSTSFRETITITQYPQMYITAHQNSDYADGNNDRNGDHNVMVNGYYSTQSNNGYGSTVYNKSTNQQTFGTVPGLWVLGGDTNVNPNMYVINVTKFSSDSNYFIGDPRQTANDTDLVNETWNHDNNRWTENVSIWVNTTALYEGPTRILKYYYPTDQTMTGTDATNPASYATGYMIAPKIRVASSYSVTHNTDSRDLAEKRCASYQEDGFPAGRWRLPTYAEAAFIVGLSNELKIPRLFNTGTRYWCAHGQFLPTTSGVTLNGTSGNAASSVRCVYDEWYWGSEQLPENQRGTFTWGDEPR